MEPLIYYPTFEPPSQTWLKFAILYFDSFKPIVPYNRRSELSDDFKRVWENSDLITLYSPEYSEGHRASLLAIEEAEKILRQPYDRSPMFRQINLARDWMNSDNWTFEVYKEKFSFEWLDFCEKNNIGRKTNDGILLPEELAFIFMSYLAKEIAFKESSAIITDNDKFDSFTNFSKLNSPFLERRDKFAKHVISLVMPYKLDAVPLKKILDFRTKNRQLIYAFNKELDTVQQNISQANSAQKFIESYNNIYSALNIEITKLGFGVTTIPLGIYSLINNPLSLTTSYAKEVLSAMGLILAGTYALHKGLKESRTKRYCKKYLTSLSRLH